MPETTFALTVGGAVTRSTQLLREAGCDSPRLDAEILLAEVLGVARERLALDRDRPLDANELARFGELVCRRRAREPVAYIVGRKAFRRVGLKVDPRVLIPRPETELLVEVGLSLDRGARVVDVGTGSGAVALALKDERPDLEVWATDVSADALAVARENARALRLEVRFAQADLLDGVDGSFDAVLANLPYVEDGAAVEPEISQYEPSEALYAGSDGLAVIRRFVGMLAKVPLVALEVGLAQANQVSDLLRGADFQPIEVLRDLAGHERVVVGRKG